MPSPRDKAKATGDTHLPEIESEDLTAQESHPEGTGTPGTQEGRRDKGRGGHHAGVIKDREEPQ